MAATTPALPRSSPLSERPRPPERSVAPFIDEIARRYLERLLGHPPTRSDALALPGIDVSDL
jgi:hypothetical protein